MMPAAGRAGQPHPLAATHSRDTADWLVKRFLYAGFSARRYSGRDNHHVRDDTRDAFARRDFQVLVSTDAGNEGIDLQTAHVLVNYDIPWSLVRLEQRMGRIHRVGQARDVELYNLIAKDTREGDVLEVLLGNFVTAANQLEGRMFDSLSLVGELVGLGDSDLGKVLADTFGDEEQRARALAAVAAVTASRLADAAKRADDQERALRSSVDVSQAVAALQNEQLDRINPAIVDAFSVISGTFFFMSPSRPWRVGRAGDRYLWGRAKVATRIPRSDH